VHSAVIQIIHYRDTADDPDEGNSYIWWMVTVDMSNERREVAETTVVLPTAPERPRRTSDGATLRPSTADRERRRGRLVVGGEAGGR